MSPSHRRDHASARAQPHRNSTDSTQTHPNSSWDGQDRRQADRRNAPTRPWKSWLTPLRREGGRREVDRSGYVDRYTKIDVALLLSIFLLNVADAFFTMLWLERGGKEANPVMDFFLDIGPWAFLAQKCLVVGFWLILLVVHKNFRFARIGLYASFVIYAVLLLVHFGIIAFGIDPPTANDLKESQTVLEFEEYEFEIRNRSDLQTQSFARKMHFPNLRRVDRPASE